MDPKQQAHYWSHHGTPFPSSQRRSYQPAKEPLDYDRSQRSSDEHRETKGDPQGYHHCFHQHPVGQPVSTKLQLSYPQPHFLQNSKTWWRMESPDLLYSPFKCRWKSSVMSIAAARVQLSITTLTYQWESLPQVLLQPSGLLPWFTNAMLLSARTYQCSLSFQPRWNLLGTSTSSKKPTQPLVSKWLVRHHPTPPSFLWTCSSLANKVPMMTWKPQ